jgi:hypothetical protein
VAVPCTEAATRLAMATARRFRYQVQLKAENGMITGSPLALCDKYIA